MSSYPLGHLSNRTLKAQNVLVIDKNGRIQFTPFVPGPIFPPEILGEIFIHCLEGADPVFPCPESAPLLLCRICRRWRDVALSTPALWSSVFLDLDKLADPGCYDASSSYTVSRQWLDNARAIPLSLGLADIVEGHAPNDQLKSLVAFVLSLSHQWRSLELELEAPSILAKSAFRDFKGAVPLLEKLSISTYHRAIRITFPTAPKLRELSVTTYNSKIQVPWPQLLTFRSEDISIASCLNILRHSSRLVNGTFKIRGNPLTLPRTVVVRPHLRHLALGAAYSSFRQPLLPLTILDCLKTPALKSLTLESADSGTGHTVAVSSLLSFISRSSPRLHTLALSFISTTPAALIECLKATPSLVHFKFQPRRRIGRHDIEPIFLQLTGHPKFLPNLESLHMVFARDPPPSSPAPVTASVLVEMLRWRWVTPGVARLRRFRLAHSYHFSMLGQTVLADLEWRRLREEGMLSYIGERSGCDTFI
ncbi:hypothetical protein B0H16DRAFT_371824 [Mycena metata]|uniref:F-box domain-containing protein n=1 Tax=Mycena metata TaxID=1033252 RepID=A0AAD7JKG7_9AGAR|nr:hypothetical protein B0H16DRAFT_371824 [Mycena metata]